MVDKKTPQEWLDEKYGNKKGSITEIVSKLGDEFKDGELLIEGYGKVTTIDLTGAKGITKLTIDKKCSNVDTIYVSDNKIKEILGLEELSNLRRLNCGKNQLERIDISKNTKLEVFCIHDNPKLKKGVKEKGGDKVVGWKNMKSLVKYSGGETSSKGISLNLSGIVKEAWKGAAGYLDIKNIVKDPKDKVPREKTLVKIKKEIEERGKRDRENREKLNNKDTGLPGLLDKNGKVNEDELKKINDDLNKIKDLEKDENNSDILDDNNKIDSEKLNDKLEKGDDYDELVENNPRLVNNETGKIDQDKIAQLEEGSKDSNIELKITKKLAEEELGSETWKLMEERIKKQIEMEKQEQQAQVVEQSK